MRIAIVADAFPPMRTSAAVQLRDLSVEFLKQGRRPTVLIPCAELSEDWSLESVHGVEVLRLKAPRMKDIGHVRRTLGELLMPFFMLYRLRRSPLKDVAWDGVVWYSPSIFFGPLILALKWRGHCRAYLILRDIFPEWAVDMGLMRRGIPYFCFKVIEAFQYRVADVIGVQAPSNLLYFKGIAQERRPVEVLQNWLADAEDIGCSIQLDKGPLAHRRVFVYAGNMGIAQGMDILIDLAERLRARNDLGFLFVGRGSDAKRLRDLVAARGLTNVLFHDEIDPSEIPGLYAQCHAGLVALDPRHKTPNIPGKFLTYMQSGLPVLANINVGNDLQALIEEGGVGKVSTAHSVEVLQGLAEALMDELVKELSREAMALRCKAMAARLFSPHAAVTQISRGLFGVTASEGVFDRQ